MNNKDYHADVSRISKSGLDLVAKSPLHYWSKYLDPNREPESPTPALIVGSAFHSIVLEPDKFNEEFAVAPNVDRRTSAGKQLWSDFSELNAGKTVLTSDQYDTIRRMRDAVMAQPAVEKLLSAGKAEHTIHWDDDDTGVACKARPDFLSSTGIVLDLKSTEDASHDSFARSCLNYRYHVQSAFYLDGLATSGNPSFDTFVFVAVEKSAPYAVSVFVAPAEFIDLGRDTYRNDLNKYKRATETGQWHGYPKEIQTIQLPAYAFKKETL